MLSFISTGIPCSGPRGPFSFRSLSSASAISSASGLVSITLFTCGPLLSTAAMRAIYLSAIDRALYFPDFIPSCSSPTVTSSNSKAGTSAAPPQFSSPRAFGLLAPSAGLRSGPAATLTPPSTLACRNLRLPAWLTSRFSTSAASTPGCAAIGSILIFELVSFFIFNPPTLLEFSPKVKTSKIARQTPQLHRINSWPAVSYFQEIPQEIIFLSALSPTTILLTRCPPVVGLPCC